MRLALVFHLDERDFAALVANVKCIDARLQLEVELLAHLLLRLRDLNLHKVAGFSLEASFNLLANLLSLMLLHQGILILLLDQFQLRLQLFLSNLLLCHSDLVLLDLLGNLVLLSESANLKMTATTARLKMQRDLFEDGVDLISCLLGIRTKWVVGWQVILMEDFVFPA